MKYVIILADGSADTHYGELGGKTLYQYATTPNIDFLAAHGRSGMLRTVPPGLPIGSEVANGTILSYDQRRYYQGRAVLEAASIGYELQSAEMAMRCNLITVDGRNIVSHSAGHISTEESAELIDYLNEHLATDDICIYVGNQYRHLLVYNHGSTHINAIPPHDIIGKSWIEHLVSPTDKYGDTTAYQLNNLILTSQQLLASHPVNQRRIADGLLPANSLWPWSPGMKPRLPRFTCKFPQIKRAGVISAVDLLHGLAAYAGMDSIPVNGITGLYNTNYRGKAIAALRALKKYDLVYLHIEAPDEAGHDGDIHLKIRTIEDIDALVVEPLLQASLDSEEPFTIAYLPDHPTPCTLRTHTADPVPFVIYNPTLSPDDVMTFDEDAAKDGFYGEMNGLNFMPTLLK